MVSPVDGPRRAAPLAAALRRVARRPQGSADRCLSGRAGAAAASPAEATPSPGGIEAVLRARLRALGSEPARHRGESARAVVEVLLEREAPPMLRADPRFAEWVDGAVAALDGVPAWRDELARLVERLTAEA
jgi:hypothetical protein